MIGISGTEGRGVMTYTSSPTFPGTTHVKMALNPVSFNPTQNRGL